MGSPGVQREMGVILNFQNNIFALFSKSILDIAVKLSRDIASGKKHLVREFDLN